MHMKYGKMLKDTRRELGISQRSLADKLGISHMTVISMENDGNVCINILEKACEILDIQIIFKKRNNKESMSIPKKYYPRRQEDTV